MLLVEVSVASEDFIDVVNQISQWLSDENVETLLSIYSGDKVRRQIRIGFACDEEGERFAARFGGVLLAHPERAVCATPAPSPDAAAKDGSTVWQ